MSNDWQESTEGELDPDLTEEAGYAGWDPPDRSHLRRVQTLLAIAVLAALALGTLVVLAR